MLLASLTTRILGLDTNPILLPIRQFGKEHHRTLTSLPQQPPLLSVPEKRLVISWWDRQINIWAITKRRRHHARKQEFSELPNSQGRRLIAKVMLTGDESITSVTVTSTGNLLAVSTIASTKIFQLIPRKDGTMKVQKIATPPSIAQIGAKIAQFSPDSKWLCLVLPSDKIRLYRLDPHSLTPSLSKTFVKLNRLSRPEARLNPENGTLGKYHRTVTHVAFSADSNLLAVSDLSGYLDTWLLEGGEDLTQALESLEASSQKSSSSSDSESDHSSDSDEQTSSTIIYGQQWIRNPAASLLPKLPGQPLVLSFRPSTGDSNTNIHSTGRTTPPATRHTPQPHSHAFSAEEDRLLAVTAGNKILEFHILAGRLSEWSRRNPPSVFPEKFRGLMDQAKGVVWDVSGYGRERCWIYGVNWLWMFDLTQDLQPEHEHGIAEIDPRSQSQHKMVTNGGLNGDTVNGNDHNVGHDDIADASANNTSTLTKTNTAILKRKRDVGKDDNDNGIREKHGTTGAGGLIPTSQLNIGLGRKMQRIEGTGETDGQSGQIIDLDTRARQRKGRGGVLDGGEEQQHDDDDDDDDSDRGGDIAADTSSALVRLRRKMEEHRGRDGDGGGEEEGEEDADSILHPAIHSARNGKITTKKQHNQQDQQGPAYWFTFKYRPILGIVPLSSPFPSSKTQTQRHGDHDHHHGSSQMNGSAMEIDVDAEEAYEEAEEAEVEAGMEVALVERPLWDVEVDLPARYHGTQEWGK